MPTNLETSPVFRTDRASLLWGVESSWGTPAAAIYRFGLHDTATLPDPDQGWAPFYGVGSGRNRDTILRGPWDLHGAVPDIRLQSGNPGLLGMVFGRAIGSQIVEGLSTNDQRLPSMTMVHSMYSTDGSYPFVREYVGGKVNRASLSAREGEDLRLSLEDIIFKDIFHNLTGTDHDGGPSVPSDPGITTGSRFMFSGASIDFNGQAICAVRDFSLSINHQLQPRHYLCKAAGATSLTQVINDLQEGKREYGLQMGIDVLSANSDLVLFQYLMDNSGQPASPTDGFTVNIAFDTAADNGTGTLAIHCSPSPTRQHPGTVVTGGKINMPGPPAGVYSGDYQMNVSSVTIDLPA